MPVWMLVWLSAGSVQTRPQVSSSSDSSSHSHLLTLTRTLALTLKIIIVITINAIITIISSLSIACSCYVRQDACSGRLSRPGNGPSAPESTFVSGVMWANCSWVGFFRLLAPYALCRASLRFALV